MREKKAKPRKAPKKISEDYLNNAGMHYLQRFSSGTENFRRIMNQKIERSCRAHPEQDRNKCKELLDKIIDKFTRIGLLCDEQYLHGHITTMRKKGLSQRAIMSKLQSKGFSATACKAAIQSIDEEAACHTNPDLEAAARYIKRRRLGPFSNDGRKSDPKKNLAALARAGFSQSIALKVLALNTDQLEEIIRPTAATASFD